MKIFEPQLLFYHLLRDYKIWKHRKETIFGKGRLLITAFITKLIMQLQSS